MKTKGFMHNRYIRYILVFLFSVLASAHVQTVQAQTYPVQANIYIMPPYGKHLNDYYITSKEKLVVSLLNRDQMKPILEVRLRMTITASNGLKLQSKEEINYPTITLDANIPTRLTQDDLAPYFKHINAQGYLGQGKLPDGMVEFTFQAIEKYTGKVLSAPATGRIWLSTQKPPLLRLPSQDEAIGFRDPMNLKFQWEPQHKNLSQVEYEFELRELPDNGVAPQSAFMYAPVIHQERLLYTYLMYDVMMPPLDPNKRYGWRVRAIAKDGVDELNMFENSGYSEVFWFRTQDNCLPPAALSVDLQSRRVDIKWLPEIGNNEFVVQYRPKFGTSEIWQEINTYDSHTSIYDMQRGTVYEYRVGAICTIGKPVFTNTGEISIPAVDSTRLANCGVPPKLNLENKDLLPELKVGDRVMLSDYPMTITKVSGANGNFSGEGWVPVNWLLETKWAVEFSNITVNTDYTMIQGSVRAMYDETEGNIANIDHITEGGSDNTRNGIVRVDVTLDFSIPEKPDFSYNEEKGELIVYDTSGNQQRVELPKNNEGKVVFPVTVKDQEGNLHQVDVPRDENGDPKTDGSVLLSRDEINIDGRMEEVIVHPNKSLYYLQVGTDTTKIVNNRKITLAQENRNIQIKLFNTVDKELKKDSIYWEIKIGAKALTIKETLDISVNINTRDNININAYKQGEKKEIIKMQVETKKSPFAEFKKKSSYKGEFGFDDGKDFKINTAPPKSTGVYETFLLTDNTNMYLPFITIAHNQSVELNLSIKENISNDSIFIMSSNTSIETTLNEDKITIQNVGMINTITNPAYIEVYRTDKYNLQKNILIGKCEIVSRPSKNIDVQVIYFAKDTSRIKNKISLNKLEDQLNNHSLNQAFCRFTVNPSAWLIRDTLSVITRENKILTYNAIKKVSENKSAVITYNKRPNTIYVIMTEIVFPTTPGGNQYAGGGVMGKNNFAVMWDVPDSKDNIYELITHEFGHSLGLDDIFSDAELNYPPKSKPGNTFSQDNFMDYFVPERKSYYKTQIRKMINLTP